MTGTMEERMGYPNFADLRRHTGELDDEQQEIWIILTRCRFRRGERAWKSLEDTTMERDLNLIRMIRTEVAKSRTFGDIPIPQFDGHAASDVEVPCKALRGGRLLGHHGVCA